MRVHRAHGLKDLLLPRHQLISREDAKEVPQSGGCLRNAAQNNGTVVHKASTSVSPHVLKLTQGAPGGLSW